MISAPMISLQAQSHPHTATKAQLRSVRTAHAAAAVAVVADVVVVAELVAIHSTALRQ
jgi:hypothetical protein